MTTALLLVAHGSPLPSANQDLLKLVEKVRAEGRYRLVEPAFLEGATPDIPAGLAACVAQGAERVVIVPYFLLPGKHVGQDLPRFVEVAHKQYPQVEFLLGEHLSVSEQIRQAVLRRIRETGMLQ